MSEQVRYGRAGTYIAHERNSGASIGDNVSTLTANLTEDPNLQDTALTYIRISSHVNTDGSRIEYTFLDENDNEINAHYRTVSVATNSTQLSHRTAANTQFTPTYYSSGSDGTFMIVKV